MVGLKVLGVLAGFFVQVAADTSTSAGTARATATPPATSAGDSAHHMAGSSAMWGGTKKCHRTCVANSCRIPEAVGRINGRHQHNINGVASFFK